MKASVLSIHWHEDTQPIYSASFQPNDRSGGRWMSSRLATAGGDRAVRLWRIPIDETCNLGVQYLATLSGHTQAVNAVSWNKKGDILASAGDDGHVYLWSQGSTGHRPIDSDPEEPEYWYVTKRMRSTGSEIYDISWAPNGLAIAAACMDHIVRIFDLQKGLETRQLQGHSLNVQGVAWDPLGEYLVTQSSDKSIIFYSVSQNLDLRKTAAIRETDVGDSRVAAFQDEKLPTFFRRLSWSPDGALVLVPSGLVKENKDGATDYGNAVFCINRRKLSQIMAILPQPKSSICTRFCPVAFKGLGASQNKFALENKFVYAVALEQATVIYDTDHEFPIGMVANLHYAGLTDLAWSHDGRILLMTSIDGFCSLVRFEEGELGEPLHSLSDNPVPDDPQVNQENEQGNSQPIRQAPTPEIHVLQPRRKKKQA